MIDLGQEWRERTAFLHLRARNEGTHLDEQLEALLFFYWSNHGQVLNVMFFRLILNGCGLAI